MRHFTGGVIIEMKLDHVAFAYADKTAGYVATEGPEGIVYAITQTPDFLYRLEMNDDLRRMIAIDWRRHLRCRGEDCFFDRQVRCSR